MVSDGYKHVYKHSQWIDSTATAASHIYSSWGDISDIFITNSASVTQPDPYDLYTRYADITTSSDSYITYSNYTVYKEANWKWHNEGWGEPILRSPKDRLREIMRQRSGPGIIVVESKRNPMRITSDVREQRARETLARMLGPDLFRKFLRDGFITAKNSESGKVYQIFTGNALTKVYEHGKLVARLCVVLRGNFPPTDTLIVRYLLALNDENKLWELADAGSATQYYGPGKIITLKERKIETPKPLTEIFAELKNVA